MEMRVLRVGEATHRMSWTPEADERLRALAAIHDDDARIADELEISFEAVRHRRLRLGIMRRRATNLGQWTPETVDRLKELRAAGFSSEQIAQRLGAGFTRRAVIGKARRLGLPRLPRKLSATAKRIAAGERKTIRKKPKLRIVVDNAPDEETPPVQRKSILELTDQTCRWPIGEPGHSNFFFCGAETAGFAYCPKHHARAYQRGA